MFHGNNFCGSIIVGHTPRKYLNFVIKIWTYVHVHVCTYMVVFRLQEVVKAASSPEIKFWLVPWCTHSFQLDKTITRNSPTSVTKLQSHYSSKSGLVWKGVIWPSFRDEIKSNAIIGGKHKRAPYLPWCSLWQSPYIWHMSTYRKNKKLCVHGLHLDLLNIYMYTYIYTYM